MRKKEGKIINEDICGGSFVSAAGSCGCAVLTVVVDVTEVMDLQQRHSSD